MRIWAPLLILLMATAGCVATDTTTSPTDAGSTGGTTAAERPTTTPPPPTSTTTGSRPALTTTSTTATSSTIGTPPPPDPFDAWIAVLASLPAAEYTQAEAETEAKTRAADVLLSDDYGSLVPGYWVVYRGAYDFAWEAEAACPTAVTDCYVRYLAAIGENEPIGYGFGTAVAVTVDGELVAIDASTGAVARTLDRSFGGDGSYPGAFSLAGDGTSVYFTVGFEDFWFSCDASDGTLLEYDFAAGRSEQIGDGFSPDVSADGRYLLYLASSECFPDPNEPQWVLAPIDTIVRRDLTSGAEDRVTVELGGDVAAGYELWSAVWSPRGEAFVLDTDGVLWQLTTAANEDEWNGELEQIGELEGGFDARLIGWDAARDVLLYSLREWIDDGVTTSLRGFDPDGSPSVLATVDAEAAFALDSARERLLTIATAEMDAPGTTVLFTVPVAAIDW